MHSFVVTFPCALLQDFLLEFFASFFQFVLSQGLLPCARLCRILLRARSQTLLPLDVANGFFPYNFPQGFSPCVFSQGFFPSSFSRRPFSACSFADPVFRTFCHTGYSMPSFPGAFSLRSFINYFPCTLSLGLFCAFFRRTFLAEFFAGNLSKLSFTGVFSVRLSVGVFLLRSFSGKFSLCSSVETFPCVFSQGL